MASSSFSFASGFFVVRFRLYPPCAINSCRTMAGVAGCTHATHHQYRNVQPCTMHAQLSKRAGVYKP
jgi:hypothetical protein